MPVSDPDLTEILKGTSCRQLTTSAQESTGRMPYLARSSCTESAVTRTARKTWGNPGEPWPQQANKPSYCSRRRLEEYCPSRSLQVISMLFRGYPLRLSPALLATRCLKLSLRKFNVDDNKVSHKVIAAGCLYISVLDGNEHSGSFAELLTISCH